MDERAELEKARRKCDVFGAKAWVRAPAKSETVLKSVGANKECFVIPYSGGSL